MAQLRRVLKLNGETREIAFAQPIQVSFIRVFCETLSTNCTYNGTVFGN
jgi:hypothetical protein